MTAITFQDGSIDLAVGCTETITGRRSSENLYDTGCRAVSMRIS